MADHVSGVLLLRCPPEVSETATASVRVALAFAFTRWSEPSGGFLALWAPSSFVLLIALLRGPFDVASLTASLYIA
jgi:hypothetical protein